MPIIVIDRSPLVLKVISPLTHFLCPPHLHRKAKVFFTIFTYIFPDEGFGGWRERPGGNGCVPAPPVIDVPVAAGPGSRGATAHQSAAARRRPHQRARRDEKVSVQDVPSGKRSFF